MSGYLGDLSPAQEDALKQFRVNVRDILKPKHDDQDLLRWLRARSFDMKKSEKMFRDSMQWRKDYGADTILDDWEPPEVLKRYYPGGYFGHCKKGYPIFIDVLGTVDLKGMFNSVKPTDVYKYKVYAMEMLYQRLLSDNSRKFGKRIDKAQLIFDMEGIGMKHLWKPAIDAFCEMLIICERNYPESMYDLYIIHAPAIFPLLYSIIKPFLSEPTRKKIQVLCGSWKQELLKYIDADQLPVHWGGTRRGPNGDEYCADQVCIGGTVPQKYWAKNQQNFVDMNNFSKATVNKGSSLQLDYDVKVSGYVIRWQFLTDDMDIGFGLFRKTAAGKQKASEMDEIIPTERVNSHIIPEDGCFTCDAPGSYVVRFDNTYSYLNSKKISYLVEVLKPDTTFSTQM